jgi:hypothetical protein
MLTLENIRTVEELSRVAGKNDQVAQKGKRYTGYAGLKREYKQ